MSPTSYLAAPPRGSDGALYRRLAPPSQQPRSKPFFREVDELHRARCQPELELGAEAFGIAADLQRQALARANDHAFHEKVQQPRMAEGAVPDGAEVGEDGEGRHV